MNSKHCVYRDCGNSSAFSPKITFFSFPLKDVEKCKHWAKRSGCEEINLKNKYLCENHFSTIYISKTARRTVLLPNAMPYSYDENKNMNVDYEENFTLEKNTSHDEIILDTLDDENEIIYSNTIEMIRPNEDGTDDNVETLEEQLVEDEIENMDTKDKIDSHKLVKFNRQKIYDNSMGSRVQKVGNKMLDHLLNAESPADVGFINHVTKRQKLHTSATDNGTVANKTGEIVETVEKCIIDEDKNDEIDDTVNNPDIATFNLKGEEYIQMPKRIYLQQRAKLYEDVKRLQKYRNILQDIKSLVNSTD